MKNTKAKFSNKTKEVIYERDNKCCIICWDNTNLHFHHCLFWTESIYTKDRNNVNMWVCICANHHSECHSCSKWEWVREECIKYLKNYA
jgi:hypothetical protein